MNLGHYVGHHSQLWGVEEVRLVGGKGDGMRLIQVHNAAGLAFTVSADRCADISRLSLQGCNMGYFSPCGYVAPAYYDHIGTGFLKSFTGGFLTTCGLTAVGSPCNDMGEELPLHGSIGNTPCDRIWWDDDETKIYIHAVINDGLIFAQKLRMTRTIACGKWDNTLVITDTVQNCGDTESPVMLLYHMNMGYPLLNEKAIITIPSVKVEPRNERAAEDLDTWHQVLEPQARFEEQCYYHFFDKEGKATIYNPELHKGLTISFDPEELPYFTQWKMMGVRDYVMGLEPGNCTPDGRDVLRRTGKLQFLQPGERKTYRVKVDLLSE